MKSSKYILLLTVFLLFSQKSVYADVVEDSFGFNNIDISGYNSPSTADDATAMVVNPGGIGIKGEGELFLSNSISSNLSQTNAFATYANFNLGYQQFTPKGNTSFKGLRKYVAGAGYPIFGGLSLGLTYYNIQTTDGSNLGTSSIDCGFLTRPSDSFSIGFVLRNLNTPVFGKTQINRTYTASFGFRPNAWDRLTFTLDGEWVEGSPWNKIRGVFGAETEFFDGIIIKGKVATDASFSNFTWSFNTGINFPYIGIGYGRVMDSNYSRDAGYLKFSLNQGRTIFQRDDSQFAEIELKGNIKGVKDTDIGLFSADQKNSVYDYLKLIEMAKNDKDVAGIILKVNNFRAGAAVNEEIRNKLAEFKKSGKKIIAYITSGDIRDYYIASVADHIVMHPVGELQLQGFSTTNFYFKDLMDKVGIEAQFESVGKYKSANEPLTKNKASSAEKEQTKDYLNDVFSNIVDEITKIRKINSNELKEIIDNKMIINAIEAKDLKLVDQLAYYDELNKISAKLLNYKGKFPVFDISKREKRKYNWKDENKVAIINAGGTIIEGESTRDFLSGEKTMGSETVASMLDKARRDDSIKAVVLRVDSGGGSALASDIIAREITRYKEDKKPLVVSMANVAASGGYWLATDAAKIVADSNTLTGSIGVFTGKINFSRLFKNLGINTETVKIGAHADAFDESRPFSDEERKIVLKSAESLYRTFIERVSSGRNISVSKVEEIAQGRIYSGKRAKELNLIDEIGGLDTAVQLAQKLADLNDKKVEVFNMDNFMDSFSVIKNSPAQAFYPFVLMKLFSENSVLAIIPPLSY